MFHSIVTPPAAEPIDIAEARAHLRVDGEDEDALIRAFVAASRRYVEQYLNRQLVAATWRVRIDRFPCGTWPIELQRPPVQKIGTVSYLDDQGETVALTTDEYGLDVSSEPGRLVPAYDTWWPNGRTFANAIDVTFVAGYVTPIVANPTTDNFTAKGRTYANGDAVQLSNSGGQLPDGFDVATTYYVVGASGNDFGLSATLAGSAIAVKDSGDGTHFIGTIPESIRAAMLLMLGHLFEHREAVNIGNITQIVPLAVQSLLDLERWDVR